MSGIIGDQGQRSGTLDRSFKVRAWINFDGRSGQAVQGNGNVAGFARNSSGNYTCTFTEPMQDDTYAAVTGSGRDDISNLTVIVVSSSNGYKTAAQVRVQNLYVNSSGEDTHRASIIVVR